MYENVNIFVVCKHVLSQVSRKEKEGVTTILGEGILNNANKKHPLKENSQKNSIHVDMMVCMA